MSSFYDDASLVVIPSGYKTSKVYAEKPTDGSGDLAFTRTGDTATRVNSAGLIEKVRTNLLLRSQEFDNAYWLKEVGGLASAPVVTANAELAPDGTMTAERIVFNLNGSTLSVAISQIASAAITITAQENTGSVYLKTTDGTSKVFTMVNPDGGEKTITVTGTYQRFTNTSSGASAGGFRFRLRGSEGTADSASIAAWGAQFESGVATDYIPTTTAAVSVGPVANVPRLDYLGSTCPRLLLEPQRTNALIQADTISVSNWAYAQCTLTSNVTGLDGYSSGRRITNGVTATDPYVEQSITTSVNTFTFSAFVKQGTAAQAWLYPVHVGMGGDTSYAQFTFATKTFVNIGNIATSGYQEYANGWYRIFCSVVVTGAVSSLRMRFSNGQVANVYNDWAFPQVEIGTYATSYIPTLAASATRGADACSKTGISSLIGQTEGVVFVEAANLFLSGSRTIALLYTSGSAFYQVYINASNQFRVDVNGSFLFLGGSIAANTNYKIAFAYKSGEYALYINGAQIATSASTTMPSSLTAYYLGNSIGSEQSGAFSQALLFKTRLTNAELAELTTL